MADHNLGPQRAGCRGGSRPWAGGVPEDGILDGRTGDLFGLLHRQVCVVGQHGFLSLEFLRETGELGFFPPEFM